jgi:hypothetical protein
MPTGEVKNTPMNGNTKITEIFIYRRGKYYYIEYLLLNEDESESKRDEYRAIKYSTLKNKLDDLLKEYELV